MSWVRCCVMVLALVVAGCGSSKEPPPANQSEGQPETLPEVILTGDAEVYSNVRVLSGDISSALEVEDDVVYFPLSAKDFVSTLSVGDVIVSATAPGFIRVVTDPAPISQSSSSTSSVQKRTLGVNSALALGIKTTIGSFLNLFRNIDLTIPYAPSPLIEDASGTILVGDETFGIMSSKATLSVRPTVAFHVKIIEGALQDTSVSIDTTLTTEEEIRVYSDVKISWDPSLTVWKSPLIPIRFVLGGVPIFTELQFDAKLHATASLASSFRVTAGTACSMTHSSIIRWTVNDGWSGEDSQSAQEPCKLTGPTIDAKPAEVALGAGVTIDADWKFMKLGGIGLAADGSLNMGISACSVDNDVVSDPTWKASADVSMNATADFAPFGVNVGSYSKELYARSFEIGGGTYGKGLCTHSKLFFTQKNLTIDATFGVNRFDGEQITAFTGIACANGLAADAHGNVYFGGNQSLNAWGNEHLYQLTIGNAMVDLGIDIAKAAGPWHVDLAVSPKGEVYYTTPTTPNPSIEGGISKIGGGQIVGDLNLPKGLTFDASGNLYFADTAFLFVDLYELTVDGALINLGRVLPAPSTADGVKVDTEASDVIVDMAVSPTGEIVYSLPSVTSFTTATSQEVVIPGGIFALGGTEILAGLNNPNGLTFDAKGNLYFGDYEEVCDCNKIYELTADRVLIDLGPGSSDIVGTVDAYMSGFSMAIANR